MVAGAMHPDLAALLAAAHTDATAPPGTADWTAFVEGVNTLLARRQEELERMQATIDAAQRQCAGCRLELSAYSQVLERQLELNARELAEAQAKAEAALRAAGTLKAP